MKQTTQVRANLKIDDALLLDLLREKSGRPLGEILSDMLQDSSKWLEAKKKLRDFKECF